jgi:hypothetical protein
LQESVRLYSEECACSAAKAEEKEEESFQGRLIGFDNEILLTTT